MTDSPELFLEAFNSFVALLVLYLGFRILFAMRLTWQKRSMVLFIAATILFVAQEALAIVNEIMHYSENFGLTQEIIESAFIVCLAAAMYLVIRSERLEISVLRRSAELDPLTRLYNINYFRRAAARRFEQSKQFDLPLTAAMLDIDDFKQYNDAYGHEAGNIALQAIARTLQETARSDDLLARYGGEEFVILMISHPEAAQRAAERIRVGIESRCKPDQNAALRRQITVSVGLAALTPATGRLEELIEAADQALYCAKKMGKNQVSTKVC